MKILLVSEHYDSLIGGTATYVKAVSNALASRKIKVELIVPNTQDTNELNVVDKNDYLRIHYLGSLQILNNNYRKSRTAFVTKVNSYLEQVIGNISPDVLHVLVGMYLMEGLETESLQIPCCVTLHNVPPRECSRTWKGDSLTAYLIEKLRLNLIKAINYRRLLRHKYDAYIPGSYRFGQVLSTMIPDRKIIPIEDGFLANMEAKPSKTINYNCRLLTIGAYIPHKGQHLILATAAQLRDRGLDFSWTLIGPIRVQKYYQYLQKQIIDLSLSKYITLKVDVPRQELETAYASSDIYVQPSLEEGFCFTALEAAFYQLPIVGTNEGAIPEIIRRGQGILSEPSVSSLVQAILDIQSNRAKYLYTEEQLTALIERYSWTRMTDELLALYQSLAKST
ncbi:MAG: glycosyltransferase family 4 protein [Tatlockia sp.]|nr:glycosyltransferase family 4 protein [Tatlockia sp.]